jgi:hypothetical protein
MVGAGTQSGLKGAPSRTRPTRANVYSFIHLFHALDGGGVLPMSPGLIVGNQKRADR